MIEYPITSHYLILKPDYTDRILWNYEYYESALLSHKTELVGITTNPACYGFEKGIPKYFPKSQEMLQFADIEGCIIIRLKDDISERFLYDLISKINRFCGFFELDSVYRVDKTENYYLIEFDTESG